MVIDVETTGLHPVDDAIIEFAMLLPTDDLEVGEVFGSRSVALSTLTVSPARMDSFVRYMHTRSGLLAEMADNDTMAEMGAPISLRAIDHLASRWLRRRGFSENRETTKGIILGSSCRLDLTMIELQMPETAALLSHRMMDVSGYREQVRHFAPEHADDLTPEVEETLAGLGGGRAVKHRALYDALQTLAEARAQRQALRSRLGIN